MHAFKYTVKFSENDAHETMLIYVTHAQVTWHLLLCQSF